MDNVREFAVEWVCTIVQTIVIKLPLEWKWDSILRYFDHDDKSAMIIGTCLSLAVTFFAANFMLSSLDLFGKPEFLMKYKIYKNKNVPVDRVKYFKCFLVACMNKSITCGFVYLFYPLMKYTGMTSLNPLPTTGRFIAEYMAMIVINEILFYYFHRIVHTPALYKHLHKMHHEWITPVGFASIYSHPVDHVTSHVLPILLPPIMIGSHMLTTWVWIIMYLLESSRQHGNFHFPFLSPPQFHDYHHLKFTENFGSVGWLDVFHGTSKRFLKSIESKRAVRYFDFTPILEKYPDPNLKSK